ncbi:MAG: GerMN domain-containing protein [Treponema sp.]|nr:GerMN domain-containing protein [Treponema sp.]
MKFDNCINFLQKNRLKIALIVGAVVIFFAALYFVSHLGMDRRVFYFPVSGSSRNQKEIRYLDSHPVQGKLAYYVDELILGPSFYRGRPLFTPGTAVDYCFVKEKTLYVGLSAEAALQEGGAFSVEEGAALFKKNIKKNFTGIKNIELFIDGNFIAD